MSANPPAIPTQAYIPRAVLRGWRWLPAAALAAVALATPGFLLGPALLSLVTTVSYLGCVAMGVTLITLSGNIMSFSLGATVGIAALTYIAASNAAGLLIGIVAALLVGAVVTGAQGVMVGVLRANPIIVSIAASVLIYGLSQPITGNGSFYASDPGTMTMMDAKILGLPVAFLTFVVIFALAQYLLIFTAFGRHVYLVGDNFAAARTAGIRADLVVIGAYTWAGLFASVAGILLAMRYARASMDFGLGYDYSAIAAVLVGGTAIAGGQGSALRTFAGVMAISVVQVVLLLWGFRQEWQYLITGVVVLGVILVNSGFRK